MPTNEELLAVLQQVHEVARNGFEANRDSGSGYDQDYQVGRADAFEEILEIIEPAGFTTTKSSRLPCPKCKTDIHSSICHIGDHFFIRCAKCDTRGPICELASSAEPLWNLWVKEKQHA
jgi:hypothetical protein